MNRYFVSIIFFLFSCSPTEDIQLISPSKKYILQIDSNDSIPDKPRYGCVRMKLHKYNGEMVATLQTGASSYAKWAVGWDLVSDTVLFQSSDIGTTAYAVRGTELKQIIPLTSSLKMAADSIFNKKHKNRE